MAKGKPNKLKAADVTWVRIDPYTHQVAKHGARPLSKPTPLPKPPKPMAQCPDCGTTIRQGRLVWHQRESCPARFEKGTSPCPNCGAQILAAQLGEHLQLCPKRSAEKSALASVSRQRRGTAPKQQANIRHEETCVYEDSGNFMVLYRGEVIDIVGSAKIGWEILREHKLQFEG